MNLTAILANFLIFVIVRNATKSKENYEVQNFKAIMKSKKMFKNIYAELNFLINILIYLILCLTFLGFSLLNDEAKV